MKLERTSFVKRLGTYVPAIDLPRQPIVEGRLLRMVGLTLEAEGLRAAMGSRCVVINDDSDQPVQVEAEVMGFSGSKIYLMPVGSVSGIAPGARVVPLADTGRLPMGMSMLGRILDGAGRALDGKGGMKAEDWVPMDGPTINPLKRDPISQPLDVGIRSINGLLTVGRGQRLGLFAGTGVGKSVLLGMMTRFTEADIIVVGLIGERGREVKEFIEHTLGEEGLRRSVVVASPADEAPLMRLRAAMYCTRIAEYFRDKGKNVLLLMDSLTRFAQAQREIALAIGEPPATKGYPPSPSCPNWWNGPVTPRLVVAPSLRSIRCCPKVMTSRTRLPTPREASSTATSCCRGDWPRRGITRPSTSRRPSAGSCPAWSARSIWARPSNSSSYGRAINRVAT
jgi:flagellum-specific ATP synthase